MILESRWRRCCRRYDRCGPWSRHPSEMIDPGAVFAAAQKGGKQGPWQKSERLASTLLGNNLEPTANRTLHDYKKQKRLK